MTFSVLAPRTVPMRTRDGVRLDAEVWAPDAPGRYPVLLMRQPYGRRIASTVVYAHPAWYAAQGYIVAVQDVRGAGSSEGQFRLFADEAADGADAVAWAAELPGSDGQVGMYGFSYQGNTQLLALAGGARPAALAPAMVGWTVGADWAWENGAFRLASNVGWALQMAWLRAVHDGQPAVAAELQAAARVLPLSEAQRTAPAILQRHAGLTHHGEWVRGPEGAYWDGIAPRARLAGHALDVPALHVGGWNDQMLTGTLDAHAAFVAGGAPQRLVVGPWTHQPWGRRVGAMDLGPAASSPVDALQLAWFERHLKGRAVDTGAALTLFDMGARVWRDFAEWPETRDSAWFLASTGRAAATSTDGVLSADAGAAGEDVFVHDPWRPVPSLGGFGGPAPGIQDRAALDDRADVACYTSAPLPQPLFLCGRVRAVLEAVADQASFDVSATLSMVAPDGRAWTVTAGYMRRDTGGAFELPMRATCVTVPAGYALRLSLAGACFPAYAVNCGDGRAAADFHADAERVIAVTIRHGGVAASRLVLPLVV